MKKKRKDTNRQQMLASDVIRFFFLQIVRACLVRVASKSTFIVVLIYGYDIRVSIYCVLTLHEQTLQQRAIRIFCEKQPSFV